MTRFDARSALIVVDLQNDFADPGGSLALRGADRVVAAVNELIAAAEGAGAPIFYTQDWHPERTPHFVSDGGLWPAHCVADTWGAQLHPGLRRDGGAVVRKGANGEDGYSGFTMRDARSGEERATELEGLLRERGVERVVVVGLATDYCVKATALDALALGFEATVVTRAVAAVNLEAGDGEAALAELAAAGAAIERGASA